MLLELKEELDRLQAELKSWSKETVGQVSHQHFAESYKDC